MHSILDEATIGTAVATREEEVGRLLTEREVRRQTRSPAPTAWSWRVEPGKEEEFDHLRGWLLSSLGDGHVGAATAGREAHLSLADLARSMPTKAPRMRCRRRSFAQGGARLVGRAFLGAGRRLVEWSGEPL